MSAIAPEFRLWIREGSEVADDRRDRGPFRSADDGDGDDQRTGPPDRRSSAPQSPISPWHQPQTYISIVLAALTIGTFLWNSARTAEANASRDAQMGRDLQALSESMKTLQTTIVEFTLNDNDRKKDIEYVLKEQAEIKNTMGMIEKAYQVQVGQRLVALELKNNIKPPGAKGD